MQIFSKVPFILILILFKINMNNFKKIRFNDFIKLNRGFDLPSEKIVEGIIPVVTSSDIKSYHLNYKVLGPGVITGRSGTLGIVQYVDENYWPHNTTLYVKDFKGNLPKFVYYFLKTMHLENFNAGVGVPTLNQNHLHNQKIFIPSLPIQQKIASILSSYDELIENNKQRIQLLEEMAEEIYKEWFVRLRFPGYETTKIVDGLPEGWEVKKLGDILETVKRKPKISTDKYLLEGIYPIIDQGDDFIAGYTNDKNFVQFEPLPLLVFGDHTRRVKFVNYPFASGADGTQLLSPSNKNLLPIYFYIMVKNIDLSNFHYARHFKFLKQEFIVIPDNKNLKKYNELVISFYDEIQILKDKNQLLQETRDLLLPRLISGKLSVAHLVEEELGMVAEERAEYKKTLK